MRLYRGLKEPYRSEEVRSRYEVTKNGTDFTDCPFTALAYATGRKGEVLVVDVPDDAGLSVTEELWLGGPEKRFMIWCSFDRWLIAVLPAKELRAEVRGKGIGGRSKADKGEILKRAIERRIGEPSAAGGEGSVPREAAPTRTEQCARCGCVLGFGAAISVAGRGTTCFACYNTELAAEAGVKFDNALLQPVTLRDSKGVPHTFRIHSRLALGVGHVMEAIEEVPEGLGYSLQVVGPEECDGLALFRELYSRLRSDLEVRYLEESPHGLRFVDGRRLAGSIRMDFARDEPILVVDGRPCSWEEIGRLLLTCEGWNVEIEIRSALEATSPVPWAAKSPGKGN